MKRFRNGDRIIIVENADDVGASCIRKGMTGVVVDDRASYDIKDEWYRVKIDGMRFTWGLQDHHMELLDITPLISESDLMEVLL